MLRFSFNGFGQEPETVSGSEILEVGAVGFWCRWVSLLLVMRCTLGWCCWMLSRVFLSRILGCFDGFSKIFGLLFGRFVLRCFNPLAAGLTETPCGDYFCHFLLFFLFFFGKWQVQGLFSKHFGRVLSDFYLRSFLFFQPSSEFRNSSPSFFGLNRFLLTQSSKAKLNAGSHRAGERSWCFHERPSGLGSCKGLGVLRREFLWVFFFLFFFRFGCFFFFWVWVLLNGNRFYSIFWVFLRFFLEVFGVSGLF